MATPLDGIWNQIPTMDSLMTKPMDSTNGGSSSGGDSASISANDFLTLLVTEMQNQDPTADTDPNEYINQLVQVNSLEQLISINQTLTSDSAGAAANGSASSSYAAGHSLEITAAGPVPLSLKGAKQLPGIEEVSGNLTIPVSDASAIRVAQSLGDH